MRTRLDPLDVVGALRGGVATLDALALRLGGADRDELTWALAEAAERGWVRSNLAGCEPDGLCGASAPAVYVATDAGRAALRR